MKIKHRDGKIESFSKQKLRKSIRLSFDRMGIKDSRAEEKITSDAVRHLPRKGVLDTEDVRNAVCRALKDTKHHNICDFYSLVWLHFRPVTIRYVIKLNGRREKFSVEKLLKSVQKSFAEAYMRNSRLLELVMRDVLEIIDKRHKNKNIDSAEIKAIVDYVLVKRKLPEVAKHYIVHRYM